MASASGTCWMGKSKKGQKEIEKEKKNLKKRRNTLV
jgi:hypothetical protein